MKRKQGRPRIFAPGTITKVEIYMSKKEAERLRAMAARVGTSTSKLVRDWIDDKAKRGKHGRARKKN